MAHWKRFTRPAGYLLGSGFLVYVILIHVVPLFFPLPPELDRAPEKGVVFQDRNGVPMRRLLTGDGLRVDPFVAFEELPRSLIEATVAAEDHRFFTHNGIDFAGIVRAVYQAADQGRLVSGASTITQQLVKLTSPKRRRDFRTKLREMAGARKVECFYSKEEILSAYLNRLPYGNQLTGCRAAARRYFGKPVGDLSLAESAFLAGLPNKPSRLNPYRNLTGAKGRQTWVLGRMLEEKFISRSEYEVARAEPIVLQPFGSDVYHAPHFIDLFVQESRSEVDRAREGNVPVATTLDLDLQQFVEGCVTRRLVQIAADRFHGEDNDLQAAVVVIDNPTGEVLALTGSRSFFDREGGQINGAWKPRSAGSTLKPFTYLMALEKGYSAASVIPDIPVEYVSSAGSYQPVNFDRRFYGPVTLRHALANSLNVPAVRVLQDIGGPRVLHHLMRDQFHFTSLMDDGSLYGLGLTIGNAETRLLELTNAYACLARLGVWKPYRFRRDNSGDSSAETDLFRRENAWIIADILSDNEARALAFGYDSALRFPYRVAAKTGTSTDFRDSWTIGFTPEYTVGVWLGRFNNRPLSDHLTGALGAGPVFHDVMFHLHSESPPRWYPVPEGVTIREVDLRNGLLVNPELVVSPRKVAPEYFVAGQVPELAQDEDYTADGKTILPTVYASWWNGEGRQNEDMSIAKSSGKGDVPRGDRPEFTFRILSPMNGTTAYLDPDLPSGGQRFPLRVDGLDPEAIQWSSETLQIEEKGKLKWILLKPGTHRIEAMHRPSGEKKSTRIVVEAL